VDLTLASQKSTLLDLGIDTGLERRGHSESRRGRAARGKGLSGPGPGSAGQYDQPAHDEDPGRDQGGEVPSGENAAITLPIREKSQLFVYSFLLGQYQIRNPIATPSAISRIGPTASIIICSYP
jgi:hypothetical protein